MPPPSSPFSDPYAVLGLAHDADEVVVHAAYKALMRKYHPDVSTALDADARARALTEAYAQIGTPFARAAYDRRRAAAAPPRPPPRAATPALRPKPRSRRRAWLVALLLLAGAGGLVWYFDPAGSDDALADIGAAPETAPPADAGAATEPLDAGVVDAAADRAAALLLARDAAGARRVSHDCPSGLAETGWRAADYCTAFDLAAGLISRALAPTGQAGDPYLATAGDVLELHYGAFASGPGLAGRIDAIRARVGDRVLALVEHRPERTRPARQPQ